MPVRDKAVARLASLIEDKPVTYRGSLERNWIQVGDEQLSLDEFEARYDPLYVGLVQHIDWNRVLLEARSHQLAVRPDDDDLTGDDMVAALLADRTWPDWEES